MKQQHDPSTKPYYRCLSCPKFRNMCGGMPTRGMDLKEWCEYIRDVMDHFHLSADYVADQSEVSKRKIESIHAINIDQDIMRFTARRVELVVLGPVSRHICDIDFEPGNIAAKIARLEAELADAKDDVAYWRKENDRKAKIIDKYLE